MNQIQRERRDAQRASRSVSCCVFLLDSSLRVSLDRHFLSLSHCLRDLFMNSVMCVYPVLGVQPASRGAFHMCTGFICQCQCRLQNLWLC